MKETQQKSIFPILNTNSKLGQDNFERNKHGLLLPNTDVLLCKGRQIAVKQM